MTPKERHETGMTVFSMLMDFLLKIASLFHKEEAPLQLPPSGEAENQED